MVTIRLCCLVVCLLVCVAGCDQLSSKPPASSGRVVQETLTASPSFEGQQGGGENDGQLQGTGPAAGPANPPAQGVVYSQIPMRLSAGVALTQYLPTGTMMSFSVDYSWVGGQVDTSQPCFWEIKGASGKTVRVQADLRKAEGNLTGFVKLRPDDGPFESRIVAASGPQAPPRALSRWIAMR